MYAISLYIIYICFDLFLFLYWLLWMLLFVTVYISIFLSSALLIRCYTYVCWYIFYRVGGYSTGCISRILLTLKNKFFLNVRVSSLYTMCPNTDWHIPVHGCVLTTQVRSHYTKTKVEGRVKVIGGGGLSQNLNFNVSRTYIFFCLISHKMNIFKHFFLF